MNELNFDYIEGFDWDKGNISKNRDKHNVSIGESEEVFFNDPFFIFIDQLHSEKENRYYLFGETNEKRTLFIDFTVRKNKIRIISSRDMHRKERGEYEKLKTNSKV